MKYIAEIELDENRTTCIDCPLCNSDDYCTLQDEDDLFLHDGWDYQLSNCPLIKAYDNLKSKSEKWDMIQWAYDNGIPFVWNGESRRVWLEESDFVYLEGRYKECDQSE